MLLTQEELTDITDLTQAAAQIRWLMEHAWKFEIGASGRPKVLRAEAERKMLSGTTKKSTTPKELNEAAYH